MFKKIKRIILLKKSGLLLMMMAITLIIIHRVFLNSQNVVFENDKLMTWFPMIGMGLFALGFVILAKSKNEGYQYLK